MDEGSKQSRIPHTRSLLLVGNKAKLLVALPACPYRRVKRVTGLFYPASFSFTCLNGSSSKSRLVLQSYLFILYSTNSLPSLRFSPCSLKNIYDTKTVTLLETIMISEPGLSVFSLLLDERMILYIKRLYCTHKQVHTMFLRISTNKGNVCVKENYSVASWYWWCLNKKAFV